MLMTPAAVMESRYWPICFGYAAALYGAEISPYKSRDANFICKQLPQRWCGEGVWGVEKREKRQIDQT